MCCAASGPFFIVLRFLPVFHPKKEIPYLKCVKGPVRVRLKIAKKGAFLSHFFNLLALVGKIGIYKGGHVLGFKFDKGILFRQITELTER